MGLLLGCWLSACTQANLIGFSSADDNKLRVVSSSTMITDWTQQIAGDTIVLRGILKPGDDPHVYEPVPRDIVAIEKADLVLYNGYHLEPGLIRLLNSAGAKAVKLAVGEAAQPLALKAGSREPDPHVWGDVKNAIAITNAIRDALIQLVPSEQIRFTQNAARYTVTLAKLDRWIALQIATIPPNLHRLVTTHDAFQYYAHAYDLEVVGTLIGISTEEQPSAQTVQKLVESVKLANVPAIFAETTINPALIQTVAAEAKVNLSPQQLYSDSIGAPGGVGDSYINMMVTNTKTIVEALGGRYVKFEG